MKYRMTANQKLTAVIVAGLFLLGFGSMLLAALTPHLTDSLTTALIGITTTIVGIFGGFIARDVMKGKPETAGEEEPKDPQ